MKQCPIGADHLLDASPPYTRKYMCINFSSGSPEENWEPEEKIIWERPDIRKSRRSTMTKVEHGLEHTTWREPKTHFLICKLMFHLPCLGMRELRTDNQRFRSKFAKAKMKECDSFSPSRPRWELIFPTSDSSFALAQFAPSRVRRRDRRSENGEIELWGMIE